MLLNSFIKEKGPFVHICSGSSQQNRQQSVLHLTLYTSSMLGTVGLKLAYLQVLQRPLLSCPVATVVLVEGFETDRCIG